MAGNVPSQGSAADKAGSQASLYTWAWFEYPLRPGVELMNRLSYGLKFIAIALVVGAPLGWLVYLQYQGVTQQFDFNAKERIGIQYNAPLKEFLVEVQRHRLLTAGAFAGDASYAKRLPAVEKSADAKALAVDEMDARFGGDDATTGLRTTKRWSETKEAWARVKGAKFNSASEADKAHAEVTALAADVILNYSGNYSNLILDPDLDSYWLMDIYLMKAPTLIEAAARSTTLGVDATSASSGSVDRTIELSGLYRSILGGISDTESIDLKTAFDFNNSEKGSKRLEKVLRSPFDELKTTYTSHAEMVRGDLLASAASPAPGKVQDLIESALATIQKGLDFWNIVEPELDTLCEARVINYGNERKLGSLLGGLAGFVLAYLFLSFYVSVKKAVLALQRASARMLAGSTEQFRIASRDELGVVFSDYSDALVEARQLRRKVEEDNSRLQGEIQELLVTVSDASDGDLRVRAKVTEGAMGNVCDALNSMFESVGNLLTEVEGTASRVASSATQIQAASGQLSTGAEKQSEEINSTTAAVQEMSSNIESVATNAAAAAEAAKRAKQTAEVGSKSIQQVIQGMQNVRENVQAGAKRIKRLGDRSMEISSIISTIEAISAQTDMLALNAAIEAARAGEHGRGFSVVAEEVRKLAERTASSTKEISKLIAGIQAEINESVVSMETQTAEVEKESSVVAEAGSALSRIQEASVQSAELIDEISLAAKQQVRGANGVVKAMEVVSSIAQQAQSGAVQTRESTQDLTRLATDLNSKLSRFKLVAASN